MIKSFLMMSVSIHIFQKKNPAHASSHNLLVALFVLWLPIKEAWQVELKPLTHCLVKDGFVSSFFRPYIRHRRDMGGSERLPWFSLFRGSDKAGMESERRLCVR